MKELLRGRFSELLDKWPEFGQIERVRSEFYAISRKLYEELQAFPPIAYDYGLQALLVARQHKMVVKRIDIGAVPEKKRYDDTKNRDQVQRVEFQLHQLENWFK